MYAHSLRIVVLREVDGPRQIASFAVTAAGHKAADASESVTKSDTGGHDITHAPKRYFVAVTENNSRQRGADKAAVINEAGPHVENIRERPACKFFVPIGDYVKDSRSQN